MFQNCCISFSVFTFSNDAVTIFIIIMTITFKSTETIEVGKAEDGLLLLNVWQYINVYKNSNSSYKAGKYSMLNRPMCSMF